MAVKDTVITALRLSPAAATGLSDEIDRNIRTARAELNRSGVPYDVASSDHDLVVEAITTYCCMSIVMHGFIRSRTCENRLLRYQH